jgi:hypothetical protein
VGIINRLRRSDSGILLDRTVSKIAKKAEGDYFIELENKLEESSLGHSPLAGRRSLESVLLLPA